MRYLVPAMIVVDAESSTDADNKAMALGATITREDGPGAFFYNIDVAVIGAVIRPELRDNETTAEHAESLQAASGR